MNDAPYVYREDVEQWRPVIGYVGTYEVSDHGRVARVDGPQRRLMRPVASSAGYLRATLSLNGKSRAYSVHRLAMVSFLGPSPLGIDHINGIKTDNRLVNLEYVTARENTRRANALNLLARGTRVAQAKLTESKVIEIRRLDRSGVPINQIAKQIGVSPSAVKDAADGFTWRHVKELLPDKPRQRPTTTKLNREDVIRILALRQGGMSPSAIARLVGMSVSLIFHIVHGRAWRSVPRPSAVA